MDDVPTLLKIIEGGIQNDKEKVYNYATLLMKKLLEKGDTKNAERIQRLLVKTNGKLIPKKDYLITKSPVDAESRLPLAEIKKYEKGTIRIVLPESAKLDIEEYIKTIVQVEAFNNSKIRRYRNLLLYGPPGTGKTQTAKYIAEKTGLPIAIVRIDGLISSFLGHTSKNIRTLFDFVEKNPCILFLDEFDSIAKMRDDPQELGELKRVVNTLLQNIDSIQNRVPLIAATNHEHLLDTAVWRRFDYKIFIGLPDSRQRDMLINLFLSDMDRTENLAPILRIMAKGMSGSVIETFANRIKTYQFLDHSKKIKMDVLLDLYIRFRRNQNQKNGEFNKEEIVKLWKENNDINYRQAAELLGISLSTAHSKLSGVKNG